MGRGPENGLDVGMFGIPRSYEPRTSGARISRVGCSGLDQAVKAGNDADPGTQLRPIQNRPQFEKVKEYFDDCVRHGYTFALGGEIDEPAPDGSSRWPSWTTRSRTPGWCARNRSAPSSRWCAGPTRLT